jgi:hypothetical protein
MRKGIIPYAQKLWEVLYGSYDLAGNRWELYRIAYYRSKFKIKYAVEDERTPSGKGFLECILHYIRNTTVKNILSRSRNTHGRTLTISRKAKHGQILPENRFCKRSKGVFDPAIHIRDRTGLLLSEESIESEKIDAMG